MEKSVTDVWSIYTEFTSAGHEIYVNAERYGTLRSAQAHIMCQIAKDAMARQIPIWLIIEIRNESRGTFIDKITVGKHP